MIKIETSISALSMGGITIGTLLELEVFLFEIVKLKSLLDF